MSLSSRRHLRSLRKIPPPPQALQVGYRTLIFDDDFTSQNSIDINSTGEDGYKWYVDRMNGWSTIQPNEIAINNSVLTITQTDTSGVNYAICTTSSVSKNGQAFRYFYAEARMKFTPNPAWPNAQGGPAFWSLSTDDVWAYDAENTVDRWAELDFYEYTPYSFNGSVHDWVHVDKTQPKVDYVNYNTNGNSIPNDMDFTQWHTYGCLWTPGAIQYFLDDVPLNTTHYSATTVPPEHPDYPIGTFSQLDAETNGMTIILGSGYNWPIDVDWVRMWGTPSSLLKFDGHSPNPSLPLNANFELDNNHFSGYNSATISRDTSTVHSGNGSLKLQHSSDIYSSTSVHITRGVTAGAAITCSCYVKAPVGGTDVRFIIHFFGDNYSYISNISAQVTPNGAWQQITVSGTIPATTTTVNPSIDKPGNSAATDIVYIDDLTITYN